MRPAYSRSSRAPMLWKVPHQGRLGSACVAGRPSACCSTPATRRSISCAARRLKVSSIMRCGSAPWRMRLATRCASVLVLPEPAPAITSSGRVSCARVAGAVLHRLELLRIEFVQERLTGQNPGARGAACRLRSLYINPVRQHPRRHRLLDRQDADRLRPLLPEGSPQRRSAAALLRDPVSAGGGRLQLLRHAHAGQRAAVGRPHAGRTSCST